MKKTDYMITNAKTQQPQRLQTTAETVLNGMQLRKKEDREVLIERIETAIEEAVGAAFSEYSKMRSADRQAHRAEVDRLHTALRTLQRRHFDDITDFARGQQFDQVINGQAQSASTAGMLGKGLG